MGCRSRTCRYRTGSGCCSDRDYALVNQQSALQHFAGYRAVSVHGPLKSRRRQGEQTAIQVPTLDGPRISWGGPPVMDKY
jgi:hypothetical protein